jgi:TetR/AcrR family transcriptional regulator
MPKPTFVQLPEEKRRRFVEAALEEFVAQPFDQASVTRMVARLGIAKGSVYQYFEDKFDLFSWLLEEAGRRKLAALGQDAQVVDDDPVAQLRRMYAAGLRFWRDEPRWARVLLRAMEPSEEPRLTALRRAQEEASHRWLVGWLGEGVARGALRDDLPVEVLAALVGGLLSEGLLRAVLREAGADLASLPAGPLSVSDERVEAVVEAAVEVLARGVVRG